jgi:tetratricopeptide (TPR) repeat protein
VAQNHVIDSLKQTLKNDKEDTSVAYHCDVLSNEYGKIGQYDSSIHYCRIALETAQKIGQDKVIISAYNTLGNIYISRGDYPLALENYQKAMTLNEKFGNKVKLADNMLSIANVYTDEGDDDKCLNNCFSAMKILEAIVDSTGIKNSGFAGISLARAYSNIGIAYEHKNEFKLSLEFFSKGLQTSKELGNERGIASGLINSGDVYYSLGKDSATAGNMKASKEYYQKALDNFFEALKIDQKINNNRSLILCLGNIGSSYINLKNYKLAYDYIYRALALSDSLGMMNVVTDEYNFLSNLYEKSEIPLPDSIGGKLLSLEQMRLRSLYYFKRSVFYKDSIFNQEKNNQIVQKTLNYEFEKKESASKAQHDKEIAVAEADARKQRIILILVVVGLLLVLLFAAFVARALRLTRKQKNIIEIQKQIVEEKQKETVDSIHYAKRIQESLLPSEKYIERNLERLKAVTKGK